MVKFCEMKAIGFPQKQIGYNVELTTMLIEISVFRLQTIKTGFGMLSETTKERYVISYKKTMG